MKINELVETAHRAARQAGWWDGVIRSEEEAAMLVLTEVAEASEAVRNRYPPICQFAAVDPAVRTPDMDTWNWQLKPEGEATEIADVLIRICDFFGWKTWDLAAAIQDGLPWEAPANTLTIDELAQRCLAQYQWIAKKAPLEAHLNICNWVAKVTENLGAKAALGQAAALSLAYCAAQGLQIQQAIEIKLRFNESRPYRHGNKAL